MPCFVISDLRCVVIFPVVERMAKPPIVPGIFTLLLKIEDGFPVCSVCNFIILSFYSTSIKKKGKHMIKLNCKNCRNAIQLHPQVTNHDGRSPHCNAASTARMAIEKPVLMTGTSPIELQAVAATEGTVRIITDAPTSVISQRIRILLKSGKTMPKEIQVITRNDETAYRLNNERSLIPICSMQSFCRVQSRDRLPQQVLPCITSYRPVCRNCFSTQHCVNSSLIILQKNNHYALTNYWR